MKHVETIVGFRWIWRPATRTWWMEALTKVDGFKETFRKLLFIDTDGDR